jgi:hypothetical protein
MFVLLTIIWYCRGTTFCPQMVVSVVRLFNPFKMYHKAQKGLVEYCRFKLLLCVGYGAAVWWGKKTEFCWIDRS